jgi:DNA-binding NarL/FixJ family response regulator
MQACISALLQADFEIVGTVLDGCALVEATLKLRPDVVVTDISMPTMNGIEAVQVIRQILPDIKLIFLTMHNENSYRREAKRVGAAGYILKSAAREELSQAIHDAMETR